jgi:hypothetical protein
MALATQTRSARNGRGHPVTVTVRTHTILEPVLEGIALAEEGVAFGLLTEARAFPYDAPLHQAAVRFQARCRDYGAELRRLAALVG